MVKNAVYISPEAASLYLDHVHSTFESCMDSCVSMTPAMFLKSKRYDQGSGSVKIIYPRVVKITKQFQSQSLLSLGKKDKKDIQNFVDFSQLLKLEGILV